MLIEKPRCNFQNCRYCFDGNCYSADKYENCKVTDLHSRIAKLTVDLDNAKAELARRIFEEIKEIGSFGEPIVDYICMSFDELAELKKKYTETCTDCGHFVGCEKAVWTGPCEEHTEDQSTKTEKGVK